MDILRRIPFIKAGISGNGDPSKRYLIDKFLRPRIRGYLLGIRLYRSTRAPKKANLRLRIRYLRIRVQPGYRR